MRAFRAISHPNVLDGHPQHLRQRHPGSNPCRARAFDQRVTPFGAFPHRRREQGMHARCCENARSPVAPSTLRYPYSQPSKNGPKFLATSVT